MRTKQSRDIAKILGEVRFHQNQDFKKAYKEKKTIWGNSTISPNIFFFLHFFSSFSESLPKSEGKKRCWI